MYESNSFYPCALRGAFIAPKIEHGTFAANLSAAMKICRA